MTNQISIFDGAERLRLKPIFGELTDTDWRNKIKGMEDRK